MAHTGSIPQIAASGQQGLLLRCSVVVAMGYPFPRKVLGSVLTSGHCQEVGIVVMGTEDAETSYFLVALRSGVC